MPASNFAGPEVGGEALGGDVEDHAAAAEEGRHGVEELGTSPQHTDAARSEHLVAAERHEVGAHGDDVGWLVGDRLAGIDEDERAGGVRGIGELSNRRECAEHVRHGGEGQQFGAVEQEVEIREIELTVVGEADPADLEALLLGEHLPRNDVGMMLEQGEHDRIARSEVGAAPGSGNEVDGLGGILGEDRPRRFDRR